MGRGAIELGSVADFPGKKYSTQSSALRAVLEAESPKYEVVGYHAPAVPDPSREASVGAVVVEEVSGDEPHVVAVVTTVLDAHRAMDRNSVAELGQVGGGLDSEWRDGGHAKVIILPDFCDVVRASGMDYFGHSFSRRTYYTSSQETPVHPRPAAGRCCGPMRAGPRYPTCSCRPAHPAPKALASLL